LFSSVGVSPSNLTHAHLLQPLWLDAASCLLTNLSSRARAAPDVDRRALRAARPEAATPRIASIASPYSSHAPPSAARLFAPRQAWCCEVLPLSNLSHARTSAAAPRAAWRLNSVFGRVGAGRSRQKENIAPRAHAVYGNLSSPRNTYPTCRAWAYRERDRGRMKRRTGGGGTNGTGSPPLPPSPLPATARLPTLGMPACQLPHAHLAITCLFTTHVPPCLWPSAHHTPSFSQHFTFTSFYGLQAPSS